MIVAVGVAATSIARSDMKEEDRKPSSWLERGTDKVFIERDAGPPQWKQDLIKRRQEKAMGATNMFRDASSMQQPPSRDAGRGGACWNPTVPNACTNQCMGDIEFSEPSRPPADVVDPIPGVTDHGYHSRPYREVDSGPGMYAGPRVSEDGPSIVSVPSKVPPWKVPADDTDFERHDSKGIPMSTDRRDSKDRGGINCCFRDAPCAAGRRARERSSSNERRNRSAERRFCEVPGLSTCLEPELDRSKEVRRA